MSESKDAWVALVFGTNPAARTGGPARRGARPETDTAPVSMRLPDPPPKGPKPVQMEALDLSVSSPDDEVAKAALAARDQARRDHEGKLGQDLMLVEQAVTRCVAMQANYGVMVEGACDLFGVFAKQKIADIEPDVDVWALLGPVLGIAAGILAAEFAPLIVATKIGKQIAQKSIDAVSKEMLNKAGAAMRQKDTSLEKAIDILVAQSALASSAIRDAADTLVREPLSQLANALAAKKPLTAEQRELVDGFAGKSIDAVLESLGVPREMTAKKVQRGIYAGLVQSFETQRMTLYKVEHDLRPDARGVELAAKQHAKEAVAALQASEDAVMRKR